MTDLHAELAGWVTAEIGKQSLGEEYGAAVSLLATPGLASGNGHRKAVPRR